jgi:recombination DNA repair RAD52 pathway protein
MTLEARKHGLSDEQLDLLMTGIHPSRVKSRSGGGKTLSYVESYDVRATLIRVFGFLNFDIEVTDSKILDIRENGRQGVKSDGSPRSPEVIAQATVRLTIKSPMYAIYTETAVSGQSGPDIGEIADNAIKTAASDALKRCAINLGSQFGLSLYNNGSKEEVIRRIVEPVQGAQLASIRGAREAAELEAAQNHIEAALGGKKVE